MDSALYFTRKVCQRTEIKVSQAVVKDQSIYNNEMTEITSHLKYLTTYFFYTGILSYSFWAIKLPLIPNFFVILLLQFLFENYFIHSIIQVSSLLWKPCFNPRVIAWRLRSRILLEIRKINKTLYVKLYITTYIMSTLLFTKRWMRDRCLWKCYCSKESVLLQKSKNIKSIRWDFKITTTESR